MSLENAGHLKLDEDLAKDVIVGVQNAITSMFGVKVSAHAVRYTNDSFLVGDISGIVGMVQAKNEAVLILSFKKETVFFIVGKMYKREFKTIDKSVLDTVGELSNIIYGAVKRSLNTKGHSFKPAIPTVVTGNSHSVLNISKGKTMVIPFQTEAGEFQVQISVQPE